MAEENLKKKDKKGIVCQICKKTMDGSEMLPAELVRAAVISIIKEKHPNWSPDGYICFKDLHGYRTEYIHSMLEQDKGELSTIEKDVVESLRKQEILSENIDKQFDTELTFGQRLADKVAVFGGSWTFIMSFGGFLVIWIIINVVVLMTRPFDPYPFILLNLILSCIAALQAPVIMMSQNRQESKDRLRSEQDYKTNLKSELMIRHLNTKVDQLLSNQWQRLLEIQQMQMELMQEALEKKK